MYFQWFFNKKSQNINWEILCAKN